MVKLRYVCSQEKREANRTGRKVAWKEYPRLWVLTPTASKALLSEFSAKLDNKLSRIYIATAQELKPLLQEAFPILNSEF